MMIGWNAAEPAPLPPLTPRERLRLAMRALWAAAWLVGLFALFLCIRCVEAIFARLSGQPTRWVSNRIVQLWARGALRTLGLSLVSHGTPIQGAGAFVANHASWIDIIVLQRAAAPFLVSKSEVRDWPGIGLIGWAIGTLFIDRRAAAAKTQEMELRERIRAGDRMALFPEGTSTDGLRILPFKSSLFSVFFSSGLEAVRVQPVTITYRPQEHLPRCFYGWWGTMDLAAHLRHVLARSTGGVVEVHFLDIVRADETTGRKEMALLCSQRVRAAFEGERRSYSRLEDGSKESATPFMQ
jgi:lyso-ornithine lipid O-acyltransferase